MSKKVKTQVTEPEYDDFSKVMDHFGKYQKLQFFFVCLPVIFVSMINVNYIFVAGDVGYRCRVPECESSPSTFEVSWHPENVGQCFKPILNQTINFGGTCSNESFTTAVERCTEWIYENNNTVVTELDLACQPWKQSLIGTVHSLGMGIAMIIAGWMSDTVGRKTTLVFCSIGCFLGNLKLFATSYSTYIGLEFLEAFISGGVFTTGGVLGIEVGNKNNRMLAGVVFAYAVYMGEALFAVIAIFVPYWKNLILIICSPTILFLSYFILVKESLRWQVLNGKVDAKKTIRLIVKMNKLNIKEDLETLEESKLKDMYNMDTCGKKEGFREIFKSREIIKRFLVAFTSRFGICFIYYGLIINSVFLPGNKYTNFLLAAVVSFPGELLSMYLMNRIGRKLPLIFGTLICGVACVACGYVPESYIWLKIVLFLFGKLVAAACYTGIVTYTMELFPTSVRGSLIGVCTLSSCVGNMLAPLTTVLALVSPVLPSVCFGCTALVASALLTLTPETRDLPLMDTIEQVTRSTVDKKKETQHSCEDNLGFEGDTTVTGSP